MIFCPKLPVTPDYPVFKELQGVRELNSCCINEINLLIIFAIVATFPESYADFKRHTTQLVDESWNLMYR